MVCRLCIWHILERGLGTKLESLVGVAATKAFKLEVWATARSSDGDFGVGRGRAIALPSVVHKLFGSPPIPAANAAWSPNAISARLTTEARAAGFVWSPAPGAAPVAPPAHAGAAPSPGATGGSVPVPPSTAALGSTGSQSKRKPSTSASVSVAKKRKRKSRQTGLQGRALLTSRQGPAPLDPTVGVLAHRDAAFRQMGQPVPAGAQGWPAPMVPMVALEGPKRPRAVEPQQPSRGTGVPDPEDDRPGCEKRVRLGEPGEEASLPQAAQVVPHVAGPEVFFAVAGTVSERLEAYFTCMKKLFGVDAAVGVTWLSRCAAIFPAFSTHDSGDRVLTNNVLESYHRWLKQDYFKYVPLRTQA